MIRRPYMWLFAAFISLFYAAGFGMLGFGLWALQRSLAAGGWPTVAGVVDGCEVETNSDGEGTTYEVKVQYTYSVAGKKYQGDRLAFGYGASSGRDTHDEIAGRLRTAKTVRVRYDPADPRTSVLSYGIHRSIRIMLAFGTTWLLFVFGFTLLVWLASTSDRVLLQNLVTQ